MGNKKKICFVGECLECGGVEKSLIELLNKIDYTKYDVTIWLLIKVGKLMFQVPKEVKVREIIIPEKEKIDLQIGRGTSIISLLKQRRILTAGAKLVREGYMRLITHNPLQRRICYYELIENKIPICPEIYDVAIDYMGYGLFNTFYVAQKINAKKKISWVHFDPYLALPQFYEYEKYLKKYQYIMCVSQNILKQMEKMIPCLLNRYKVFYNIVDKDELHKIAEQKPMQKPEETTIVSVGRLSPQKGFDVGINVIDRLQKNGYQLRWFIIGEGEEQQKLKEQLNRLENVKNAVSLVGQKMNPYSYIDMCDIYFQPSRHEGYCIALAEARAFCKPIVVTDFAGAREQLKNNETGIITGFSENEIYEGLKKMIDHKELRMAFSCALAKQNDDWKAQVEMLQNIFDND